MHAAIVDTDALSACGAVGVCRGAHAHVCGTSAITELKGGCFELLAQQQQA